MENYQKFHYFYYFRENLEKQDYILNIIKEYE
jgi:hypothetical protein